MRQPVFRRSDAPKRWDVYWADLDPTEGAEIRKIRPVLIVSNDAANRALPVVTVVPLVLFDTKDRRVHSFELELPTSAISKGKTHVAQPHQIRTLDTERRLRDYVGTLQDEASRYELENRLLEHLGIEYDVEEAPESTDLAADP